MVDRRGNLEPKDYFGRCAPSQGHMSFVPTPVYKIIETFDSEKKETPARQ